MKRPLLVIVNSSTFGRHFPQHLASLEEFADLEGIEVPADIDAETLTATISKANGIIASVTPRFSRQTLEGCRSLVAIFRHGIGCDNVDLTAATDLGIRVSRVAGIVERDAVAEHAIALLMAAARYVVAGNNAVRSSAWGARSTIVGLELKGKKIGIIGLGNIGSRTAEILRQGFRAEVMAHDPYCPKMRFFELDVGDVSLEQLLREADAILFHCPLNNDTRRMLGVSQFAMMKKGALLVNTCRGELLDPKALETALKTEHLAVYATDVVEGEPIEADHTLAQLNNVIITPHLGGYTWESLYGMGQTGVNDMMAVFQKNAQPKELANPEVLKKDFRIWN